MKRTDNSLFILIITPLFWVGGFLFWFINTHPSLTSFYSAIGLLTILSATTLLILAKVRLSYTNPLANLNQQLEEPALNLQPEAFKNGSPIHSISISIHQKLNQIEAEYIETSYRLSEELNKANYQLKLLSENIALDKILTDIKKVELELSSNALADFIVFNNLSREQTSTQLEADLEFSANQLVFLMRELQSYTFPNTKTKPTDLCNALDEALYPICVYIGTKNWQLISIFRPSCPQLIMTKPDTFRSLIFNFILYLILESKILEKEDDKNDEHKIEKNLILTIEYTRTGHLTLSLSGDLYIPRVIKSVINFERLKSSAITLNASSSSQTLSIPVATTKALNTDRTDPIKAIVNSKNRYEKQSMESRLVLLGVELSEDPNNADFHFINSRDRNHSNPALCSTGNLSTSNISKSNISKSNKPKLIIWGSQEYYQDSDSSTNRPWQQLSVPLIPGELNFLLNDRKAFSLPVFDKALALKRANNRPELMQELLQILMTTLQSDIKEIVTAYENDDIGLSNQLHKLQGALQYSGASRIEQTIESISEMVNESKAGNSRRLKSLIDCLIQGHKELKVWYESQVS